MIVANIEDEVLLGADVLQDVSGPADILLSQGVMLLKGETIPVRLVNSNPGVRKVRLADQYVVPGMSEAVLDVFVDTNEECEDTLLLIEPCENSNKEPNVVVGACLINTNSCCTAKIRVLNPGLEPVTLKQDEVMGQAEAISEELDILVDHENINEISKLDPVRRIMKNGESQASHSDGVDPMGNHNSNTTQHGVPDHLRDVVTRVAKCRTHGEIQAIKSTLVKYQTDFSKDEFDLGLTNLAEHVIDTGNAKPVRQPPRRTPIAFQGEEKKAIDKMYKQGAIRPSSSPWASPLVLVRKKNGKVRPCVDYRRVNAVTQTDAFPIPKTQDCLDALSGSSMFSTLDITSAYHQIPVRTEDIPKTAFCSRYGLWEFVTMPFGLCSATATFQRTMEVALSHLQWTSCLIYLDGVVIFGQNCTEHLNRLEAVLERIQSSHLKLSPDKCHLFQNEVTFLGHVISKDGVLPNPDNVAKLVNWPIPQNATDVRSYLGLASYYRRFIKGYSDIAYPMTQLTRKECQFKWTTDCQYAFEKLRGLLVSPNIMAYPSDKGNFILDTDASDFSIGAVLSQEQDGKERVIAYGSRTMLKAERNYCVTDKELLAVKHFIEYYKHYLLGRTFVVRSDHQALKWLFSLKDPSNRVASWNEILSAYSFAIEYRLGRQHGNADGMSRCPNPRDCQCPYDSDDPVLKCGPCTK